MYDAINRRNMNFAWGRQIINYKTNRPVNGKMIEKKEL